MKENRSFRRGKIRFDPSLDLNKCLKQIKLQRLFLTCAPISELPSNISSMIYLGAMPRREGMERKDLLAANVKIFKVNKYITFSLLLYPAYKNFGDEKL